MAQTEEEILSDVDALLESLERSQTTPTPTLAAPAGKPAYVDPYAPLMVPTTDQPTGLGGGLKEREENRLLAPHYDRSRANAKLQAKKLKAALDVGFTGGIETIFAGTLDPKINEVAGMLLYLRDNGFTDMIAEEFLEINDETTLRDQLTDDLGNDAEDAILSAFGYASEDLVGQSYEEKFGKAQRGDDWDKEKSYYELFAPELTTDPAGNPKWFPNYATREHPKYDKDDPFTAGEYNRDDARFEAIVDDPNIYKAPVNTRPDGTPAESAEEQAGLDEEGRKANQKLKPTEQGKPPPSPAISPVVPGEPKKDVVTPPVKPPLTDAEKAAEYGKMEADTVLRRAETDRIIKDANLAQVREFKDIKIREEGLKPILSFDHPEADKNRFHNRRFRELQDRDLQEKYAAEDRERIGTGRGEETVKKWIKDMQVQNKDHRKIRGLSDEAAFDAMSLEDRKAIMQAVEVDLQGKARTDRMAIAAEKAERERKADVQFRADQAGVEQAQTDLDLQRARFGSTMLDREPSIFDIPGPGPGHEAGQARQEENLAAEVRERKLIKNLDDARITQRKRQTVPAQEVGGEMRPAATYIPEKGDLIGGKGRPESYVYPKTPKQTMTEPAVEPPAVEPPTVEPPAVEPPAAPTNAEKISGIIDKGYESGENLPTAKVDELIALGMPFENIPKDLLSGGFYNPAPAEPTAAPAEPTTPPVALSDPTAPISTAPQDEDSRKETAKLISEVDALLKNLEADDPQATTDYNKEVQDIFGLDQPPPGTPKWATKKAEHTPVALPAPVEPALTIPTGKNTVTTRPADIVDTIINNAYASGQNLTDDKVEELIRLGMPREEIPQDLLDRPAITPSTPAKPTESTKPTFPLPPYPPVYTDESTTAKPAVETPTIKTPAPEQRRDVLEPVPSDVHAQISKIIENIGKPKKTPAPEQRRDVLEPVPSDVHAEISDILTNLDNPGRAKARKHDETIREIEKSRDEEMERRRQPRTRPPGFRPGTGGGLDMLNKMTALKKTVETPSLPVPGSIPGRWEPTRPPGYEPEGERGSIGNRGKPMTSLEPRVKRSSLANPWEDEEEEEKRKYGLLSGTWQT